MDESTTTWPEFFENNQIKFYSLAILFGVILAFLSPMADFFAVALNFILPVLLFVTFLQVPFTSVIHGAKSGRFIMALLVGNFVFIPLVVFLLYWSGLFILHSLFGLDQLSVISHPNNLFLIFTVFGSILLCAPCVDYVVSFCRVAKGDSASLTAALPILLIIQYVFFVFLLGSTILTGRAPSGEYQQLNELLATFLSVLIAPLCLGWLFEAASRHNRTIASSTILMKNSVVIITALTLLIIATYAFSEIFSLFHDHFEHTGLAISFIYGVSFYAIFACLAPFVGAASAKLFKLEQKQAIAVSFSVSTRNSLVILPLLLLISIESGKGLVAAVVLTQTCVELVAEVFYVRFIPHLVKRYFLFQEKKREG